MSTLWRKVQVVQFMAHFMFQVPGNLNVYKFDKVYREGPATLVKNLKNLSLQDRIKNSVQKVNFLEVDTFQGVPVDVGLSENTPDPFLEKNLDKLE